MHIENHLGKSRDYGRQAGPRWLALDKIGAPALYSPSFQFDGPAINSAHGEILNAPLGRLGIPICLDLGIDGFLQRADALKIYELAYFSAGDALELGTHRGLSTSIIARALNDRGSGSLETIDIDAAATECARVNIDGRPGAHRVTFTLKDAAQRMGELVGEGRRFGFIFVDHWHGYEATFAAAMRCADLLTPGGFVQFHDFLDPGNADPEHLYGVYQAVLDTICRDKRFTFDSFSGCTAVFRMSLSARHRSICEGV
jgi:predicted O-methyltransferase YrrM